MKVSVPKALDWSIVQSTVTNVGGSRHGVFAEHGEMHREIQWPYSLGLLFAVRSCTVVVLVSFYNCLKYKNHKIYYST